jgi:hypothetical protein
MASKKPSGKSASPKTKPVSGRTMVIVSTATGSLLNMAVTAVTSGTVLLALFAAKRLL